MSHTHDDPNVFAAPLGTDIYDWLAGDGFGCACEEVEIGSYDNQVYLAAPPHMPKVNGYCIDRCISSEVQSLWSKGIVTTGCCCGHNKLHGFIGVTDEFIPTMKAMGYRVRPNEMDKEREDGFYPKTVKYRGVLDA